MVVTAYFLLLHLLAAAGAAQQQETVRLVEVVVVVLAGLERLELVVLAIPQALRQAKEIMVVQVLTLAGMGKAAVEVELLP
jgi:hypothetical protein